MQILLTRDLEEKHRATPDLTVDAFLAQFPEVPRDLRGEPALAYRKRDRAHARERRVDGLPLRERALADREIPLPNPLPFELPRESRVQVRPLRKEHHATGPPIEPLHQIRGEGVSQHFGVQVRFLGMMHPLLDDDTGGLVDEQERLVLEENIQ